MKTIIGSNDDYACLYTQGKNSWDEDKTKIAFYYGYEATLGDEWCFRAYIGDKELMMLTTTQLIESSGDLEEGDEPIKFLLQGMYLYMTKDD